MGTNRYSFFNALSYSVIHYYRVSCVHAARNVSRSYERQELFVIAKFPPAETLTCISVHVYLKHLHNLLSMCLWEYMGLKYESQQYHLERNSLS